MGKQSKKLVTFGDKYGRYLDDLADRMDISSPELVRRIVERYISRYSREEGMARGIEVKVMREYKGNMIPLEMYYHGGQVYVEGVEGQRYAVTVKNYTEDRVEAVISVDGLDISDGEEASFEKRGFVINAYDQAMFSGFRLNDDEVATFRFGAQGEGYASKIGKPRNVGVIGIAVFKEKRISQRLSVRRGSKSIFSGGDKSGDFKAIPFGSHSVSTEEKEELTSGGGILLGYEQDYRERNLETKFGEKREEKVGRTTFTRESDTPWEVLSIRYDSRANLEALGINLDNNQLLQRENADPFPAAHKGCTPPLGWSGG